MAVRDKAALFGVLGDPVDHSLSPAMHNAAFAALRLPHLYLRYRVPVRDLPEALAEARRLRMGGLNLTVPLKEAVLPLLDGLTPEARRIGAVNTILFRQRGSRLIGDNTDARGFLLGLPPRLRRPGVRPVVIGAGGSARAVAMALASAGCRMITIANRTRQRAEALATRLATRRVRTRVVSLATLRSGRALDAATLVVNTTPLGLGGRTLAVQHRAAPRGCLFVDLVYGARRSAFLVAAARAGYPTLDGAAMLLHQGALAFEAWTGRRAPRATMARALAEAGLELTQHRPGTRRSGRRPPTP